MKFDRTRRPLDHERVPLPDIYEDGKPVYVLSKGATRKTGREALRENIQVAQVMVEFVKDLFGPYRMIKMISEGGVTYVTSDLLTALRKTPLSHPAAQLMAGAAIATYRECGGGAASTVILAGKILEKCQQLIDLGVHPNTITDGLLIAFDKVLETANKLAIRSTLDEEEFIKRLLKRSLSGKLPTYDEEHLSGLISQLVKIVGIESLSSSELPDVVEFKKMLGSSLSESEIIDGLILSKEIPHMDMPRAIKDAKIALVKGRLRLDRRLGRYENRKICFEKPEELSRFEHSKQDLLKGFLENSLKAGVNVLMVEEGIDDFLLEYLARIGILAVRRFPPPEFDRVAKATGATVITDLYNIAPSDLGWAELVEERKINRKTWLCIRGCRNPRTVDILLRGNTNELLDDIERIVKGVLPTIKVLREDDRLVWGGGAFEEEVSASLRDYANELADKRQLTVNAVADAFEYLPILLGETVDLKGMDLIAELRAEHAKGKRSAGIDLTEKRIVDVDALKIYDLYAVKLQVIKTAFETALTILRIDDFIIGRKLSEPELNYMQRMKGSSPDRLRKMRKDYDLQSLE